MSFEINALFSVAQFNCIKKLALINDYFIFDEKKKKLHPYSLINARMRYLLKLN
jgi:hypothetical protein